MDRENPGQPVIMASGCPFHLNTLLWHSFFKQPARFLLPLRAAISAPPVRPRSAPVLMEGAEGSLRSHEQGPGSLRGISHAAGGGQWGDHAGGQQRQSDPALTEGWRQEGKDQWCFAIPGGGALFPCHFHPGCSAVPAASFN